MKKAFRMKQKYFSSFLKGFQLPKIVSDLRVEVAGADLLKRERGGLALFLFHLFKVYHFYI